MKYLRHEVELIPEMRKMKEEENKLMEHEVDVMGRQAT
jgi:hypothetical protein